MSHDSSRETGSTPQEEGLSLVEMLVALLLLGVLLSGFASALIAFGRATAVNEHRLQATSLLTSLHEEMQATPWNRAVLYDEEVVGLDGLEGAEVGGGAPTYEGQPIVTIPGPVNTGCPPATNPECGRLVFVPRANEQMVIDGLEFEVYRIVTEVPVTDRTEPELRRFVTIVRWSLLGRTYEQTFDSLRAPTPSELDGESDPEVLVFLLHPRQIILDADNRNVQEISVYLRMQSGSSSPQLDINTLTRIDDLDIPSVQTVPLTPDTAFDNDLAPSPGWSFVFGPGELRFDPASTTIDLRYLRLATEDVDGGEVTFPGGYRIEFIDEAGLALDETVAPPPADEQLQYSVPEVQTVDWVIQPSGTGGIRVGTIDGTREDRFCADVDINVFVDLEPLISGGSPDRSDIFVDAWFAGNVRQSARLAATSIPPSGPITFTVQFKRGDPAPWVMPVDSVFTDRFYVVATSGPSQQDSRALASAEFSVSKPVEDCDASLESL